MYFSGDLVIYYVYEFKWGNIFFYNGFCSGPLASCQGKSWELFIDEMKLQVKKNETIFIRDDLEGCLQFFFELNTDGIKKR